MTRLLSRRRLGSTGLGIGAGAALLAVMCLDSAARGHSAFTPFSLTASLVLGESVAHSDRPSVILVGLVVGTVASIVHGFFFSLLMHQLPETAADRWTWQAAVGTLYGAAVYVIAFQVVARVLFRWALEADQPSWFLGHALVFGPVLAVMFGIAFRRERARLGVGVGVR